jgi:murein DD-endopeptidase MepM/ murein hydrolase activator NlpD
VLEPNTEQSLPEIGTLKYDGAPKNPKAFVPINFNGLSLGSHAKQNGLGDRLLRGFEALTQPKAPEATPEAPSGNMGVIRYNVPSPIQTYRMQRQRRHARLHAYGRPLLIAACLAVAVPVGFSVVGKLGPSAPVAQASVSETEQDLLPAVTTPSQPAPLQATAESPAGTSDAAQVEPAQPVAGQPTAVQPAVVQAAAPKVEARVVTVKSGDTLGAIARRNDLTARELASYNGLKDLHSLKIGQKLRIPAPAVQQAQAPVPKPAAVAFKAPAVPLVLAPKPEQPGQVAAVTPAEQKAEKPQAKPSEPTAYTIRSGDTLSKIASRHGIKTATLASANGLSAEDTLSVGKVLKVPHADGVYVKLRAGESLSHLATRYGVKASAIQEANQISDPRALREGQMLFLPGAEPQEAKRDARRERGDFKQASRGLIGDLGRAVGKNFVWPTAGKVSSYFGERGGRQHHGVDIPRPKGSPIHAAKAGTVISAGWNGDYGKCVDISHGKGVVTRYAHCSKITVKPGDKVEKGELIGLVGETGRASGPHLHYEVRIGGRPVNPAKFH